MITMFCLLFFNAWPSQLGVPWWVVLISLMIDVGLYVHFNGTKKTE